MHTPRFRIVVGMILTAAISRLIPHPPNFTPIAAIALFGGAYFRDKRTAFLIPLAAMLLSDLILGLLRYGVGVVGSSMPFVYASFALIVSLGFRLREHRSVDRIIGAAFASSILFFVITNFGVWVAGSLYPRTIEGLVTCYVAAIPFFQNTLLSNALYTTLLFGGFSLAERRFPALSER